MVRIGVFPSAIAGMPPVRLVRKKAHCAGQAALVEVMVAISILTIVVWEMVGFVWNGRLLVERTGEQIVATQIAAQQIDTQRALAYSSVAASNGTVTVGGIVYTWTLTVVTAQADPADANSTFKQVGVTVTWPTSAGATAVVKTAIAQ